MYILSLLLFNGANNVSTDSQLQILSHFDTRIDNNYILKNINSCIKIYCCAKLKHWFAELIGSKKGFRKPRVEKIGFEFNAF